MNEAESLIRNVTELYLDLVYDFSLPDDLTDELYRVILDLEKNMNSGYTVRKTGYVLKYSDSQPRDDHGRWTDGGGGSSGSSGGGSSGGTASGAISGSLNPDSERAEKHAFQYYEAVRKMKTDCKRIAKNTGFDESEIQQVKDFIFMQKHDLGDGQLRYFYPSYEMAQSWQRLIDGKNIQKHDITLLRHELMEQKLMKQGMSQAEAHRQTEKVFNYGKESREYYDKIN